uniref:NADH dehydrogenase subunit 6 n=1 Tax=Pseudoniphargus gorbeanus TaxID=1688789 RepID=A0A0M6X7L9_9CRUS|nr:NADH dehydrogenase subunit 6 [Pseudoniphargus gorbeanus]
MTIMLFLFSTLFSMMFISSNSPLLLSIIIILQTITIAIMLTLFTVSSWFSFMLLMVYLSGMMIVFIYVSSVASNELFYMDKYNYMFVLMFIPLIIMMMPNMENTQSEVTSTLTMNYTSATITKTIKLFSKSLYLMTIMLIIYILLTMIMVMKNSSFSTGPLRSHK